MCVFDCVWVYVFICVCVCSNFVLSLGFSEVVSIVIDHSYLLYSSVRAVIIVVLSFLLSLSFSLTLSFSDSPGSSLIQLITQSLSINEL